MDSYPITTRGFEIPMYITLHYKVKYQPDKMRDAARDAINHYSGLAARFVDKPTLAFRAESMVVECYALLKDWNNAAGTLSRMIDKYKKQAPMDSAMMNLAMIYSRQMNDNAMAKATLEALIRDYPKSRLIGSAKQALQKLSK
jgi:TolA-binding protein